MDLEIQNLSKAYKHNKGLRPTSFRIQDNELVAIVGHNGAGKSTLMKTIGQWIIPDQGLILINGHDLKEKKHLSNKLSFVPEVPHLYDLFSVDYNLKLFSFLFNQSKIRVDQVLDQLQLQPYRTHKVRSLSKGLKQRVNIARALISDPDLLLLDEPTSGLDFEMTREVYKILQSMHKNGKTIIFSTHQPEEIKSMVTRILALHRGEIVFDGPPDDYFSSEVYKQIQGKLVNPLANSLCSSPGHSPVNSVVKLIDQIDS